MQYRFTGNLVKSAEKGVHGGEMWENECLRKVLVFSVKRTDFSYIMQTSEKIKFLDFFEKVGGFLIRWCDMLRNCVIQR